MIVFNQCVRGCAWGGGGGAATHSESFARRAVCTFSCGADDGRIDRHGVLWINQSIEFLTWYISCNIQHTFSSTSVSLHPQPNSHHWFQYCRYDTQVRVSKELAFVRSEINMLPDSRTAVLVGGSESQWRLFVGGRASMVVSPVIRQHMDMLECSFVFSFGDRSGSAEFKMHVQRVK